jgi:hypothetical protein
MTALSMVTKTFNSMGKLFSDEIERNAGILLNGTLQKLFINAGLKLRDYAFHAEKGIDFTFEIENRENKPGTLDIFFLQNKGSETEFTILISGANKGKISYKLDDVRQIDYFCEELDQPLVICICDLETETIYWEPIQLSAAIYLEKAEEIKKELSDKKRKTPAIQVYFDPDKCLLHKGKLMPAKFQAFLADIEKSKKYITARNFQRFNSIDIDKEDAIEIDRNFPILDQLHIYLSARFEEISVLHPRFWAYQYPFKKLHSSYFYYDQFKLQTDNDDVFNFLNSLRINQDLSIEFTDKSFIENVDKYEEKTIFILRTLNRNLVFTVEYGNGDQQKDTRYLEKVDCDCVRCSYEKLQFSRMFEGLGKETDDIDLLCKHGYINYQLGFFIDSSKCFLKVQEKATVKGQHLTAFIASYNLSKLYRFIKYSYSGETADIALVAKLEQTRNGLDLALYRMEKGKSVAKWIRDNRFFTDFSHEIDQASIKLRDYYFSQQWGGRGTNSYAGEIYSSHAMLETFLGRNFVIYDYFSEFTQLTEVYTDAMVTSHAVHKSMYSRLTEFNDWIVTILIFHGDAETIAKYCERHFLKKLDYKKTAIVAGFMQLARNFLSDERITGIFEELNLEENFQFQQKYTKILSNILVLAGYLVLSNEDVNELAGLLKHYFGWQTKMRHHRAGKFMKAFLQKKGDQLRITVINEYFDFLFQNEFFHDEQFLDELADTYVKKNERVEYNAVRREQIELLMGPNCPVCKRQHEPTMWVPFYHLAKTDLDRTFIKEKIVEILNRQFSWRLYYVAAIYGILGIDEAFFRQLIDVKVQKGPRPFSNYSADELNRDFRLGAIINLSFKYGIDTSTAQFDHMRGFDAYYDWLLDMNNFNYDDFNPRWVSEYGTKYYFEKIKGYPVIRQKMLEYLKEHHDPLLKDNFILIWGGEIEVVEHMV